MKAFCFYTVCLCLLMGCQPKHAQVKDKPEWVIEEVKMVDIIVDLRIADAATYINSHGPARDKKADILFIMKKHHTTDSVFVKSHDYYAQHPEVAANIYERVIDKISEIQAENADGQ